MIVSLHVATGAAGGALVTTRVRAVAVGALLHVLGDRVPHMDIRSRRFELCSGLALLALLGVRRRRLDPVTVGAVAASLPDVEHVLRLPRPRGRKLFPSHRYQGWHRPGGISTGQQLVVAGLLVGALLGRPR